MEKVPPKVKKIKGLKREDLINMDKNDLVDKIIQLEAHNEQLKNIISKNLANDSDNQANDTGKRKFDFTKCHYRRLLLRILYFGWNYQGLAVQEDSTQTIEHHLFHALKKSCLIESREKSQYHRCGRTDKGVSAFGQVISITLRSKHAPSEQNLPSSISSEMPYCKILNRLLPKEIRAVAWMPIPDGKPEFSARFDCKKRQYKYYFPKSSLDINAMRDACRHLIGSHDFRHLCKMDVGNNVTEFRREILKADIEALDQKGCNNATSMYTLTIEGNAFLWHQIRCIMGVLLLVGQGRELPSVITDLLDVQTNPRCVKSVNPHLASVVDYGQTLHIPRGDSYSFESQQKPQYNMALDVPLNLFHCSYDIENSWVYDRDELRNVIIHLQSEWTIHSVKTTMIKDSLSNLEEIFNSLSKEKETPDVLDNESDRNRVMAHADCLLQGVKPRTYTPLLKRDTCSSLEERIEYYRKKRKMADVE